MANARHLAIFKQGVGAWLTWRYENARVKPDLQDARLRGLDLSGVDLSGVDLSGADFQLSNLRDADLRGADLEEAHLENTFFYNALFVNANLQGANLQNANLQRADLEEVDLTKANLQGVNLTKAFLGGAKLTDAIIGNTVFVDTDLSTIIGLETIRHSGPSTIGIDTLTRSGKLPETFLRGCGVPDAFIEYLPSLLGAIEPIQYYSCFISYSTKDEAFARRLHERMRAEQLRVWFAPEDIQGGKKLHEQLEGAIQLYDKLLLVLSEHSIASEWVTTELSNARQTELRQQRRKLFPIRLTDMDALKTWRCFDADTGKDLAREVREYHIPDFTNWKDHDAFELAFARLLRDLRATEALPVPGALPPVVVQPSTQAHRESLIATKTRRLYKLQEQAARTGLNTPVEIQIEIEDLREELEKLRAQRDGEG